MRPLELAALWLAAVVLVLWLGPPVPSARADVFADAAAAYVRRHCAGDALKQMIVWESRRQLACFCAWRPLFRDCRNLRDPAWNGSR